MSQGPVESPLGLRERNKLEKRRRICDAARRLFAEQGFDATTIDQIAKNAHVAKGTVFLYAKTKYDLLYLVFEAAIGTAYEQAFDSLPAGTVVDKLVHLFAGFFDFYGQHPALSKIMIKELLSLTGMQQEAYMALTFRFFGRVGEVLQAAVEAGDLRADLDHLRAAQMLFGTYAMVLFQWLEGPSPTPREAVEDLRQSFQLMIEGLRTAG